MKSFAQPQFLIRQSLDQEIEMMNDLKELEQLRPGTYDFIGFKLLDNYEFWTGVSGNDPVGFIGSAVYDTGLAYLASYFVIKQFRGQGYGMKIWKEAFPRVKGINLGLNGTMQLQQNYKKWGFKTQSYGIRFLFHGTNTKHESSFLVDCKEVDFELLNEYDRKNFPGSRQKFLEAWIKLPRCKAIAYVRDNKVEGYGVMRVTPNGYKIGPMTADSYEIAVEILKSFRSQVSKQAEIILQTAKTHEDVFRLAQQFKMIELFKIPRMFTNGEPQQFQKKTIYSITSPEFG